MFVRRAFSTNRAPLWLHLTTSFETIASLPQTTGRINILSSTFQDILNTDPQAFPPALRLSLGYFHGKNTLGVGSSALRNSAAQALLLHPSVVETQEAKLGDLASAITVLFATKQDEEHGHSTNGSLVSTGKTLTVRDVANGLNKLSQIEGPESNAARESLIADLLRQCGNESEVKYLVRTLQGQNKLRIGMGEASIVAAAARGALCCGMDTGGTAMSPSEQSQHRADTRQVEFLGRRIYNARHDLDTFAQTLVDGHLLCVDTDNTKAIAMCEEQTTPLPLVPARSMLASPGKSADEAIEYFIRGQETGRRDIACQHKYDGERAQIHVVVEPSTSSVGTGAKKNTLKSRVYSRVGEDNSLRYQHVAKRVGELLQQRVSGVEEFRSCILDGEMVAINRTSGRLLPFQSLARRMRDGSDNKSNSNTVQVTTPSDTVQSAPPCDVCFYAFDLLEYNDHRMVHHTLRERRQILQRIVHPVQGELEIGKEMQMKVGSDRLEEASQIHAALEDAVKSGCEGLVVKALDGPGSWYRCGERTKSWLKLKKDYVNSVDGALDTFDLVVLAAYHGKGKRQGLYGSFLMGCRNENEHENDQHSFRTVCKVGTGFSDAVLTEIHSSLSNAKTLAKDVASVSAHTHSKLRPIPDVWFEPTRVWEVRAADISLSKVHNSCNDQLGLLGHDKGHGLALRFPRFVRFRDDKNVFNATTESQMLEMFAQQTTELVKV